MELLQQIVARAKADKQRIVLPEAEEERTLRAADRALADDLADIILIGNPTKIQQLAMPPGYYVYQRWFALSYHTKAIWKRWRCVHG